MSPHTRAVENWTLQPLTAFVREASVRLVLVLTPSGQVLAQSGFSRAVDEQQALVRTLEACKNPCFIQGAARNGGGR